MMPENNISCQLIKKKFHLTVIRKIRSMLAYEPLSLVSPCNREVHNQSHNHRDTDNQRNNRKTKHPLTSI